MNQIQLPTWKPSEVTIDVTIYIKNIHDNNTDVGNCKIKKMNAKCSEFILSNTKTEILLNIATMNLPCFSSITIPNYKPLRWMIMWYKSSTITLTRVKCLSHGVLFTICGEIRWHYCNYYPVNAQITIPEQLTIDWTLDIGHYWYDHFNIALYDDTHLVLYDDPSLWIFVSTL
jgi:hypothetical protein